MTRLKVCCIQDLEEALLAIRYGADALGLVSAMPSGPGPIPEEKIAEIAARVPPGISTFLLTSLQSAEEIIEQHFRCRTDTIQIVDELVDGTYEDMRAALPGIRFVQVIHVAGDDAVVHAREVAGHVDALLLDSGTPQADVKLLGGTGRVHDWRVSRKIVEAVNVPVFLAGGLRPENVAEAVRSVQPFALDVCSGLRVDNRLVESKLAAFTAAMREADAETAADN